MTSFYPSSYKKGSSRTLSKPLADSSRSLLRKLQGRPQSLVQANNDTTVDAPAPSPCIESAEDGVVDVDFLRDRFPEGNGNAGLSQTGFLYVVNPDPEPQSPSERHSDLSLSLQWRKLSISPRASNMSMTVHDHQSSFQDSDIVPAPLRLRKVPLDHNHVDNKIRSAITTAGTHSDDLEIDTSLAERNPPKSTTEETLERYLADMEHQITELRDMLTACEAKLSQMTNEFLQTKLKQLCVTSESRVLPNCLQVASPPSSRKGQPDQETKTTPNIDISQDAKQVTLLSHVNLVGMSAQRHRGRLPRALVG